MTYLFIMCSTILLTCCCRASRRCGLITCDLCKSNISQTIPSQCGVSFYTVVELLTSSACSKVCDKAGLRRASERMTAKEGKWQILSSAFLLVESFRARGSAPYDSSAIDCMCTLPCLMLAMRGMSCSSHGRMCGLHVRF